MQRRSPPKHRHDGTSPLPLGMDWSPPPRKWKWRCEVFVIRFPLYSDEMKPYAGFLSGLYPVRWVFDSEKRWFF
ncbi:hypothetical protein F2Q69_00033032 [Brassica cretica]|uniref:Uncharacterized protein n=1 Tax=Brassica cretica TaxID=69181 RepID=A0A8S9SKY0_BRACR|nr:hypothetical protein F2Q69_00033032 [Brassica cretica]